MQRVRYQETNQTSCIAWPRRMAFAVVFLGLTTCLPAQESKEIYNLKTDVEWPGEIAGPSRIWTPENTDDNSPGLLKGKPFPATLRGVFNEDTPYSNEFAIFELEDGTVQGYLTRSFVKEDRQKLHDFKAIMPAPPRDEKNYLPSPSAEQANLFSSHRISQYLTTHFAFWFAQGGKAEDAELLKDPTFVPRSAIWYERIWDHFAYEVHAPMPYAHDSEGKKINVVLTETGYPGASGFASSAESMGLEPIAMKYGSSVTPHEFTHVIQFYSGGFRDKDTVGCFWETHANFGAFTYEPTTDYDLGDYFKALEKGILWTDSRYGSWPILMQLYERKLTRSLVFDIWTKNRRAADGSTIEDPLETLVRLGIEYGSLPNGWVSLGDEWGELAQRLVTWDYIHHVYYEAATRNLRKASYVNLQSGGGKYLSPPDRPLRAYGIHFIHLVPDSSDGLIQVSLTGQTAKQDAAWRFGLVAVSAGGSPRYSVLRSVVGRGSSTLQLRVKPQESITLVVAATPYQYCPVHWGQLPPTIFPYSIQLIGATSR